ncbi:MAG TPA: hypothetical protein VFN61_05065 [Acidimicrobiales bacterium]|nr:hypothetical protein [Acidimicrobiales bacterium]
MARRSRYSPTSYSSAKRQFIIGVALFAVGIAVTVITYSAASSSPTGGTYIVSWGRSSSGLYAW